MIADTRANRVGNGHMRHASCAEEAFGAGKATVDKLVYDHEVARR